MWKESGKPELGDPGLTAALTRHNPSEPATACPAEGDLVSCDGETCHSRTRGGWSESCVTTGASGLSFPKLLQEGHNAKHLDKDSSQPPKRGSPALLCKVSCTQKQKEATCGAFSQLLPELSCRGDIICC